MFKENFVEKEKKRKNGPSKNKNTKLIEVSSSSDDESSPPQKKPNIKRRSEETPHKFNLRASALMEKLGCGSDVCVYKYVRGAQTPLALKRLTKDADHVIEDRLKAEANYLKLFNHPNIVEFRNLEALSCPGSPTKRLSVIMELCDTSLEKLIEARLQINTEPFLPSRILTVGYCVGRALEYIHDQHHILHGDLKSANVLISGDFDEVKLCDFGVCVPLKTDNQGQASPKDIYQGTEQWWPKETLGDHNPRIITDRTDIYPYGLILWEMLTLEVPHERWLKNKDETKKEDDEEEEEYNAALGTCPPLPSDLKKNYSPIIELIVCCCNENWKNRPRARRVVKVLKELMD